MFSLPSPLHPAVVHFPIVFVLLLPLAAIALALAIRLGKAPQRAWLVVVALGAALVVSGWAAEQTGGREERRVEKVVGEQVLEAHAGGAERFVVLSGLALIVLAAGLAPGAAGGVARGIGVLASLGLMLAGWQVGHTGGALVYEHDAASAYSQAAGTSSSGPMAADARAGEQDGDDG